MGDLACESDLDVRYNVGANSTGVAAEKVGWKGC